eukprot:gene23909-28677_t
MAHFACGNFCAMYDGGMSENQDVDFFISYNKADKDWAVWIAWILEHEDYTVIIEEWDFKAGGNFAIEMDRAMAGSERTIAVLSPNYLAAHYVHPEWTDKFADDPEGLRRLLVPIMVEPCDLRGILKQVIHIDIVGLDQDNAKRKILTQISPGRTKPAQQPGFPGVAWSQQSAPAASSDSPVEILSWEALANPVTPSWQIDDGRSYSSSTIELRSFSISSSRLEARELRDLPNFLAQLGRSQGLFETTEAVNTDQRESWASASSESRYSGIGARGIAATRDRELVAWTPLPSDGLGSIFDETDVKSRLEALLGLHLSSGLLASDKTAFALSVSPVMMMQLGSVTQVGQRSSANLPFATFNSHSFRVDPEDSVRTSLIANNAQDIVEELVARLDLKMRGGR